MHSEVTKHKGVPEGHPSAAVAVEHELYYFGNNLNDDDDHIDVHVFNTVSLHWRKLTPGTGDRPHEVPSRSYGHTAVLVGDTVYLWGGGWRNEYYHMLYAFDVDTHRWSKPQVSGTVPVMRYGHSACVLGKVIFVHGGRTYRLPECTNATKSTYKLDTSTMVWTFINTSRGTPSTGHSATVIGTKMFVFGGYGWDRYNNTIRVFDTDTNLWSMPTTAQLQPEGRKNHSAFTYNGELYIFGGCPWARDFNDLWKCSPETFSWRKVVPKGKDPGPMRSMCCCIVGDRIFLFGGLKQSLFASDELYILNLSPGLKIPSLKTLCKIAVLQYGLEQSELPHNIRWELAAMDLC